MCAQGMEQYWLAFTDMSRPKFVLQRLLPQRFRSLLLREVGLSQYQVTKDPREVSQADRSPRWIAICEALERWPDLTTDQQCRLIFVLHALCCYAAIVDRIPDISATEIRTRSDRAELAYRRASARYVLGLQGAVADYGDANLSALEAVATAAPRDLPIALTASMMILVHKAKTRASVEELERWRAHSERALQTVVAGQDEFAGSLLTSRFFRAAAFLPQRRGDRAELVRMMDLSEHYARAASPSDPAQNILRLENLYPLIESRTKEALWLGDLELALERARSLIELDPYDSRAWLELGEVHRRRSDYASAAEAYATAAMLGPPSTAIGCHMAGLCFEHLGQPLLAAYFFQAAIAADPQAISPRDEIQRLPDRPVLAALKDWGLRSFEAW